MTLHSAAIKLYNLGYSLFTFELKEYYNENNGGYTKTFTPPVGWTSFTYEDCKNHIKKEHNAIALITGQRTSSKKNPIVKSVIGIDIDRGDSIKNNIYCKCGFEFFKIHNFDFNKPEFSTVSEGTGNNGMHYIYEYTNKLPKSSAGIYYNGDKYAVDIRSNGGCLIIAPSFYIGIKDQTKKVYKWVNSLLNNTPKQIHDDLLNILIPNLKRPCPIKNIDNNHNKTTIIKNIDDNKQVNMMEIDEINDLIDMIHVNRSENYDNWILMGATLHQYGEYGLRLFHKFSKKSNKYDKAEVDTKFNTFSYSVCDINNIRRWAKFDNKEAYFAYRENHYQMCFDDKMCYEEFKLIRKIYQKNTGDYQNKDFFKMAMIYFNHYLCCITKLSMTEFCFLTYKNNKVHEIIRKANVSHMAILLEPFKYYVKTKCKVRTVPFFDYWKGNFYKTTYDTIDFIPYTFNNKPADIDKVLNLFTGFRFDYNIDFVVDNDIIKPVNNHVFNVLCNKNKEHYQYFTDLMASWMQNAKKMKIATIVSGGQGCGKSSFFDFIGNNVMGSYLYQYSNNMEDMTGRFATISNKILTVLDECNVFGGDHGMFNRLKSMITQDTTSHEKKGKDKIYIKDYNNIVLLSNDYHIAKIEHQDRRYFCLEPSNKYAKNKSTDEERKTYFDQLFAAYNDPTVAIHYYHFLMKRDISKRNFESIPQSEFTKNLKKLSLEKEIYFIKNLVDGDEISKNIFESKTYFYSNNSIYDDYVLYCKRNNYKFKNSNNFLSWINKELPCLIKARKVVDGVRLRGFTFDVKIKQQLIKYLKEYDLHDDEKFIDVDDYECNNSIEGAATTVNTKNRKHISNSELDSL